MGLVPTPGAFFGAKSGFEQMMVSTPSIYSNSRTNAAIPGGQIAMIFQMSSLNPVYTCGFQLTEAIRRHQNVSSCIGATASDRQSPGSQTPPQ